ncbi:MAG: tetratricopeptide repeat protein [Bacteroidia bacterium]|nr:tetratricopeptide repeat protein [Bacteroidia bacterium]
MGTSKKYILFFIFLLTVIFLDGQGYYIEYDKESRSIYNDIINLKLDDARNKLAEMDKVNHLNLSYLHLENYLDFFELFISEDESRFDLLKKNKKTRLKQLENKLLDNDPYKRFVIAEIHLQWALTRSKFGELFRSGREIYKAYHLLDDNMNNHPDFIYNNKSLSIIHALIETVSIPGFIKSLFGIEGSIKQGLKEIKALNTYCIKSSDIFLPESEAIYMYILFYQGNQKELALELIQSSFTDYNESPLVCFLKSKLLQRAGKNDEALVLLEDRQSGSEHAEFLYLDYLEGLSRLRQLDPSCMKYFESFVKKFNGRHFIKEAYQKLAWSSLVFENDTEAYKSYMALVKIKGSRLTDDDKQAYRESLNNYIPNPILLKSRLLYDGGYYTRTLQLLDENKNLLNDAELKSEYQYRLARVNQALENYTDAIAQYEDLLSTGKVESYFNCNAALQLGLIYEELGELQKSEKYFKTCLRLNPKVYRQSLHQKARSGLNRIVLK